MYIPISNQQLLNCIEQKINQDDSENIIQHSLAVSAQRSSLTFLFNCSLIPSQHSQFSLAVNSNKTRQLSTGNSSYECWIEPKQHPEKSGYYESLINRNPLICKHTNNPQGDTKSHVTCIKEQISYSCGNLISIFPKTYQNTNLKLCNKYSMSKLQRETTYLSFIQFLMIKEKLTNNVRKQERDYNPRESCYGKMAANTKLDCCFEKNFLSMHGDKRLCISNSPSIMTSCNQINGQPLSDNTKISDCNRLVQYGDNKNISSTRDKRKIEKTTIRRRKQILVNQPPLRQISKTNNRRRSELLDMSVLKVLHSSVGRIFVTLSALAFVTLAAGSPSYGNPGK